MSTDYTHFDRLAFNKLFGYGPDGGETLIINSSGAFVGNLATTGTLTVGRVLTNAGSASTCAVTIASAGLGLYRAAAKQLGFAAGATNIATITTAALLVAKALTVTGAATASNLSGTNTGDNVNASSSVAGIVSTGVQSFAGAKTFVSTIVGSISGNAATVTTNANLTGPITSVGNATTIGSSVVSNVHIAAAAAISGSKIVSASSAVSGVMTTGSQSFAGTKTFVTPLTGTNVASASTAASGVITTGAQSFTGAKNFKSAFAAGVAAGTNTFTGNLTASDSSTAELSWLFSNTEAATGTSNSAVKVRVGGTASGDPYTQYRVTGGSDWSQGIDNSDSDKFKLSQASSLGTNDFFSMDTNGAFTLGKSAGNQSVTIYGSTLSVVDSNDTGISIAPTATNKESYLQLLTPNGSTVDSYVQFITSGGTAWATGKDTSDSNKFKISNSGGLGTNDYLTISTGGVVTIGTGTTTQHVLNTLLATNGSATMTILNGPAAASAGNPVGWIQKTINGTTRYMPFW